MSWVSVPYSIDGDYRWAIWSTVTDSIIAYELDSTELIEMKAERAEQRVRRETATELIQIKQNNYEHQIPAGKQYARRAREKLDELPDIGDVDGL